MMKIISWSSFPNVRIAINPNGLLNFQDASIKKMIQSFDWKIENLYIQSFYTTNIRFESIENVYNYVISEYGMNVETYGVFKLLVSTNLINSLKQVYFIDQWKVDFKFLHYLAEQGGVSDLLSEIKFVIIKP